MALRSQIQNILVYKFLKVNSVPVRYRKPKWVPLAKSKEFYVRKPTPIDPEEYSMLNFCYSQYRAEVKSIRQFLHEQLLNKQENLSVQQVSDDAHDLMSMEEQVLEWNKKVAVTRNARLAEEMKLEEERIKQIEKERAERKLQKKIEAEKKLKKNIAMSSEFITSITADKLDAEIEKLLDSRSDYNFAITKSGDILKGEFPQKPTTSK
ncbi:28S ribosomal protein S26 mitochondrial [Biomphalaria pfeifferi]|uniref:Small ribosomal subunit protein mS26 n=1 Tax=Biomphalaria pfeifferi TaxID=112525 RepID=A0AAD8CCI3_BIOPF|nr:28S ribosomal protein S26 mitochondrial [Biomphalaria pfeifferi]